MAASGLNAEIRMKNADPDQHLKEMMQFAIQLMRVVREFNKDLLEFNLILRIG
jgi:adenylate cyclase 9